MMIAKLLQQAKSDITVRQPYMAPIAF